MHSQRYTVIPSPRTRRRRGSLDKETARTNFWNDKKSTVHNSQPDSDKYHNVGCVSSAPPATSFPVPSAYFTPRVVHAAAPLPNHAYQRRTPEFTDVQSLTNRELTGVHGVALLCSASIFPLRGRFFLHFFHSALASPPSGASCPDQPKKEGDPHPREPPFPFRHSAFFVHLSQIDSVPVFQSLSSQR